MSKIRMSKRKFDCINAIADKNGIISALAMDQRGSLQKAISKSKGSEASAADLSEFKMVVAEELSPFASAILLDPDFGLEAVEHRAKNAGILLAYEKTGYDASVKGRLPDLLPEWSVRRLVAAGADAIKFLLHYDPDDDDPKINRFKQAFLERVGAECRANDVALFLEPHVRFAWGALSVGWGDGMGSVGRWRRHPSGLCRHPASLGSVQADLTASNYEKRLHRPGNPSDGDQRYS